MAVFLGSGTGVRVSGIFSIFCRRNQLDFDDEEDIIGPMTAKPRPSQTRSCYQHLRRQLLHGQLAPESRLVEEKWAAQLGVHRSAVREALMILAHDGLVEVGERGGFFVPKFDQQALDEVQEVRLALEVGAIRMYALRNGEGPHDFRRLHEACDLMEQNMKADCEFGFVEADRRFHEILVEMAGNRRLMRVYRQAPLPLAPLPETEESARRANMRRTLAEHRRVVELLDEGRVDDAVEVLRRHLLVPHSYHENLKPGSLTPA
jgi:DNA-binding GntR family transcriptional regulator